MGPIGILVIGIVILFIRVVFRAAAIASNGADDKNATGTPAQSVANADAQTAQKHPASSTKKVFDRIEMQRHISARKAELQAQRANKTAAQATPSSKNPTKSRLQPAAVQPEQTAESSTPDAGNKWMEGFDIRRAVVWSEILRPKFREEEA